MAFLFWAAPIAAGGVHQAAGMFRFALLIFPYHALLAGWARSPRVDQALTVAASLLQGFLMVFWACGFRLSI